MTEFNSRYDQDFKSTMALVDQISELCDGVLHENMMFALTMLQAQLLVEMEPIDRNIRPKFYALLDSMIDEAKEGKQLLDMDETQSIAH